MIEEAFERINDVKLSYINNGQGGYKNVFVTFCSSNLSIAERGERLMDIEESLIKNVASNIRLWHVPIGDKNSLRRLRGVSL